jgi:hypothetical protein
MRQDEERRRQEEEQRRRDEEQQQQQETLLRAQSDRMNQDIRQQAGASPTENPATSGTNPVSPLFRDASSAPPGRTTTVESDEDHMAVIRGNQAVAEGRARNATPEEIAQAQGQPAPASTPPPPAAEPPPGTTPDNNPSQSSDGQTLSQQTAWTQQAFRNQYGAQADTVWAAQHEAELERNKRLYGSREPAVGTPGLPGTNAPPAPDRRIGATPPPGPGQSAAHGINWQDAPASTPPSRQTGPIAVNAPSALPGTKYVPGSGARVVEARGGADIPAPGQPPETATARSGQVTPAPASPPAPPTPTPAQPTSTYSYSPPKEQEGPLGYDPNQVAPTDILSVRVKPEYADRMPPESHSGEQTRAEWDAHPEAHPYYDVVNARSGAPTSQAPSAPRTETASAPEPSNEGPEYGPPQPPAMAEPVYGGYDPQQAQRDLDQRPLPPTSSSSPGGRYAPPGTPTPTSEPSAGASYPPENPPVTSTPTPPASAQTTPTSSPTPGPTYGPALPSAGTMEFPTSGESIYPAPATTPNPNPTWAPVESTARPYGPDLPIPTPPPMAPGPTMTPAAAGVQIDSSGTILNQLPPDELTVPKFTGQGFDVSGTFQEYQGAQYAFGAGRDGSGFGTPGSSAYDCSSFVSAVMRDDGVALVAHTDGAYEQLTQLGAQQVSVQDARPGDIVFYMGSGYGGNIAYHEGIYAGNGTVLDMSTGGGKNGVAIRPLNWAGNNTVILRDPRVNTLMANGQQPPAIQPSGVAEAASEPGPNQTVSMSNTETTRSTSPAVAQPGAEMTVEQALQAVDTPSPLATVSTLSGLPSDQQAVAKDGVLSLMRGEPSGAWAESYLNDVARLAWAREERTNGRTSDPRLTPVDYIEKWKDAFFGGDRNVPLVADLTNEIHGLPQNTSRSNLTRTQGAPPPAPVATQSQSAPNSSQSNPNSTVSMSNTETTAQAKPALPPQLQSGVPQQGLEARPGTNPADHMATVWQRAYEQTGDATFADGLSGLIIGEGGMQGGLGDQGQSSGIFQFYWGGGEGNGFQSWLGQKLGRPVGQAEAMQLAKNDDLVLEYYIPRAKSFYDQGQARGLQNPVLAIVGGGGPGKGHNPGAIGGREQAIYEDAWRRYQSGHFTGGQPTIQSVSQKSFGPETEEPLDPNTPDGPPWERPGYSSDDLHTLPVYRYENNDYETYRQPMSFRAQPYQPGTSTDPDVPLDQQRTPSPQDVPVSNVETTADPRAQMRTAADQTGLAWYTQANPDAGEWTGESSLQDVGARIWQNAYQMSGNDAQFATLVGGLTNGEGGYGGKQDEYGAAGIFQFDPRFGEGKEFAKWLRENNYNIPPQQAVRNVDLTMAYYLPYLKDAYDNAKARGITDEQGLLRAMVEDPSRRGYGHNNGAWARPNLRANYVDGLAEFKRGTFRGQVR